MQLQLFIPGLLWPGAQTRSPCEGLALPALERLLRMGNPTLTAAQPADAALLALFGLPESVAIAPLRRLGEQAAPAPDSRHWLCADPVALHFAREHLLLMDASELAIDSDEATALVDGLNQTFPDIGRFELGSPGRWYLCTPQPARARFTALADAVSRPVMQFMPTGDDALAWHRLINEIQVWMHNHPVNQAREAAGRPTINSLWPWGGGDLAAKPSPPATALLADAGLACGLGRSAGMGVSPLAGHSGSRITDDTLVCLEHAHRPALYMDLAPWQEALRVLERDWFEPALSALQQGRIDRLRLIAPGDRASLELSVERARRWHFWRPKLKLQNLIERQP